MLLITFFKILLILLAFFWLSLTFLAQFPFFIRKLRFIYKYDKIYFFPIWKLFSPNPINTDYVLLYKDLIASGDNAFETDIQEVKLDYYLSLGNKGNCALFKNLSNIHFLTGKFNDEKSFLYNCKEFHKIKYLVLNLTRHKDCIKRQVSCFAIRYNGTSVKKKLVFSYIINY